MSLFDELKRRNVLRVAIAYIIVAWLVMQVADVVLNNITAPGWIFQVLMLFLAVGFPFAVIFAWAFELTPEGLKREHEVDRSQSIASHTGRRIDFLIIGVLVIAVGMLLLDKFPLTESDETAALIVEDAADTPDVTPSIAVLPFENRSNRKEDEFFVDGIHDDLLTTIAKISSLKVISRTSVMEYKNVGDKKIPQIARELGVTNILEGSIQRAGNKVRINMQLINAESDEHLWAEIYDRELTIENLFDVQSEISLAVAEALHATLSPDERRKINTAATSNLEAYDAYLRGKQLMATREPQRLEESIDLFRSAVELDPEFALAWVGLADSLGLFGIYGLSVSASFPEAREEAINTALAIAPDLGEAYASLGTLLADLEQDEAAENAYRKAIELSPNYATGYQWLGIHLRNSNQRVSEALKLIRKAAELDPRSGIIGANLSGIYRQLGDYAAAREEAERVLQFDPGFAPAHSGLGAIARDTGRLADAYKHYNDALDLDPANTQFYFSVIYALALLGNEDGADLIYGRLQEIAPDDFFVHRSRLYIDFLNGRLSPQDESIQALRSSQQRFARRLAANMLSFLGDYSAARDAYLGLGKHDLLNPEDWPDFIDEDLWTSCNFGWVLMQTSDEDLGRAFIAEVLDRYDNVYSDSIRRGLIIDVDICYLAIGDTQKALNVIEQQLEHGYFDELAREHRAMLYDSIREHPRFIAVNQQVDAEILRQRELAGF